MSEQAWQDVEADLAALRSAAVLPSEALELLEGIVAARRYPPDVVRALISAMQAINGAVGGGQAPPEAVESVVQNMAQFTQPGWSPEQVNNAAVILNMVFRSPSAPAPKTPPPVPVPVVLVAMSAAQAAELADGSAFAGFPQDLGAHFGQLEELLIEEGVPNWRDHYGGDALGWRPFGASEPTMEHLIQETLASLNADERYDPPIAPDFPILADLATDRRLLRDLRQGCVVILDSLSMRHPAIQKAFFQSMLDASPATAVLVFAPSSRVHQAGRALAVFINLTADELEFGRRMDDQRETFGMCIHGSEQGPIQQWLATRIRELAPERGASSGIRRYMQIGG